MGNILENEPNEADRLENGGRGVETGRAEEGGIKIRLWNGKKNGRRKAGREGLT
jgi:hypothetical protein